MKWRAVPLDEVTEVAAGNPAPQEPSDFSENGAPFIRMQDVGREHRTSNLMESIDRVSSDAIARHRLRPFPAGSVLIPKSGASVNLNHRAMLGRDAYVVSHLAVLVPDRERLLPEYLYLWSLAYDPRNQAQTTSLPSLPLSLIKAANIPLPSLDEQRRLVDILSRAEGIVRLRREAQKKAAELIPALFLDMFGDPAINPKGWPMKPLGEFVRIIGGSSLPAGEAFVGQVGGLLLIKVSDMNLQGNEVEMVISKEWGPEPQRSYSKVHPKTIVFPKRGAAIATNKKRITTRPALLDPNLMGVESDEQIALTSYLFQWFSAFDLSDITSGTTVPQLNKGDLMPLAVPLPPMNLQTAFEQKRRDILSIQSQQATATQKAQATFDALLARTFSGL